MRSEAATVAQYLDELPDDRREAIEEVRAVVLASLPDGYEETMEWGMITYQVPLERYPDTYNGKPLMYAGLASQKNHMALYLTGVYMTEGARDHFERAYAASGKRLDMGKSCVRFKAVDDLPLDVVANTISAMSPDELIAGVEEVHSRRRS